jgi:hypothetical protein
MISVWYSTLVVRPSRRQRTVQGSAKVLLYLHMPLSQPVTNQLALPFHRAVFDPTVRIESDW